MTLEIFVVRAFMYSEWVDLAELDDEDATFQLCDTVKQISIDAKIVRRLVMKDHINFSMIK